MSIRATSETPQERARRIFHAIAPVYSLFFRMQRRTYRAILSRMADRVGLRAGASVLDVGCGTGALCSVMAERGLRVTCAEPVERMLAVGRSKRENRSVTFVKADALEGLPFPDRSFDFVLASYVAHGMPAGERKLFYRELRRVAGGLVILQDYNQTRAFLTDVVERMEGGDYFGFIEHVGRELDEAFSHVEVVNVGPRSAWYICRP